jgi:hypothetical protein
MRGTTVTTPDGHVWMVRRRWARRDTALRRYLDRRRAFRRMLWIRRGKRLDLEMVGPTSRSWVADTEVAQEVVVLRCAIVILAATAGLGLLGWFVVTRLAPSIPHPGAEKRPGAARGRGRDRAGPSRRRAGGRAPREPPIAPAPDRAIAGCAVSARPNPGTRRMHHHRTGQELIGRHDQRVGPTPAARQGAAAAP